jgi:integrase
VGRDENGRPIQRRKTFQGGKRDAQRALKALVAEVDKNGSKSNGTLTVGKLLDEWLEFVTPRRQPGTIRGYATIVRRIKQGDAGTEDRPEVLGNVRLDKLSAEHLDRAYAVWLGSGLSSTTVHHTHVVLATALHQAVRWRRIPLAVTDLAEPPAMSTFHVEATDPSLVRRLITEAEGDYPILAAAIAFAAVTGCRRGALCGLQWSDLDQDGVLHVQRAIRHAVDRSMLVTGPTKTHQDRKIALDQLSVAIIENHRTQVEKWATQAIVQIRSDSFILSNLPSGALPMKPDTITEQFRSLTKRLGIKLRFHDLRHCTATQLKGKKVDPVTVAGRLGHRDPSITMRVYSFQLEERDKEAGHIIGVVLAGPDELPILPARDLPRLLEVGSRAKSRKAEPA